MNRLSAATATAWVIAAVALPASAGAAVDSANTSIPVDPTTQIEMHVNANCVLAEGRCFFDTRANLMTPDGPAAFPQDVWARQTITLRSTGRDVWQEAEYSAPAGTPRETKGANQNNVLSKLFKSLSNNEISITYFGGGPIERFATDGSSVPTNWSTGRANTAADFIVCSQIQVVYGGVNLTVPTACAQTGFS